MRPHACIHVWVTAEPGATPSPHSCPGEQADPHHLEEGADLECRHLCHRLSLPKLPPLGSIPGTDRQLLNTWHCVNHRTQVFPLGSQGSTST